jgi:hypothetical protein
MDYSFIISQIRLFYRLRHDGYTHRHYSSPLFMVSKPCLDSIKRDVHDIIGASIFWGPIVTRRDTVRFWVRQARDIQPKLKN